VPERSCVTGFSPVISPGVTLIKRILLTGGAPFLSWRPQEM